MSVFQFKQFSIKQEKSAMKVGTDGVLLGAWVNVLHKHRALDVGTGTGLLSLMMAQRNSKLKVDAIEIDEAGFEEARHNVLQSKFKHQIQMHQTSFEKFESERIYDLIVTNPPYYYGMSRSLNESRDFARHGKSDWISWIKKFSKILLKEGEIALISPSYDFDRIKSEMESHHLFAKKLLFIRPNKSKPVKRVVQLYSFEKKMQPNEQELTIELDSRHQFSQEYKALLADFLTIF